MPTTYSDSSASRTSTTWSSTSIRWARRRTPVRIYVCTQTPDPLPGLAGTPQRSLRSLGGEREYDNGTTQVVLSTYTQTYLEETDMARAVGIDLGTTNSVIAVLEGGEPTSDPQRRRRADHPSVVSFKDGEVLVGEVAKRQAITNPDQTVRSVKRHMGDRLVDRGRRQEATPPGDLGPHPDEAEARRRVLSRRHGHRRGDHRPCLLQRRPASGHEGGRPDRRAQRAPNHQRAHRGLAGLWARQGSTDTPSSSSTWAAAPSTSRCSRSARASSRSRRPQATPSSVVTTGTRK